MRRVYTEPAKPEETLPAETTSAEPGTDKETTAPEKETSTSVDLSQQETAVVPESSVPVPTADGKVVELLGEIVEILRETEPEETIIEETTEEAPPPYAAPLETVQLELAAVCFGVAMCFGALLAKFFWKGAGHDSP